MSRELQNLARQHFNKALEFAEVMYGAQALDYLDGLLRAVAIDWSMRYPEPPKAKGYQKAVISAELRRQVFERDGYRCVTCGDWHNLGADHIQPEVKGGPTTLENLQTMCRSCNSRKGART